MTDPTFSEPPSVSTPTHSWLLEDHIDAEHFAALKAMSSLTVSLDVLEMNGNRHVIDLLDNDKE